jgi:hypothetical protein
LIGEAGKNQPRITRIRADKNEKDALAVAEKNDPQISQIHADYLYSGNKPMRPRSGHNSLNPEC